MKSSKHIVPESENPRKETTTGKAGRLGLGMVIAVLLITLAAPLAPARAAGQAVPEPQAVLQKARTLIDQEPTNRQNLLQAASLLETASAKFPQEIRFPLYLAEIYYRLADPSADVSREFPSYEKSGKYAQKVLAMNPNRAEGHYWYGLYLLKKAQKRGGIGAYFIVKDGIRELEKVRQTMPAYDHAGASRVLGLLHCLAPGWSPFGDLDKSIQLGKEAIRLAPDYVLNRLYLADAYHKRGDKEAAIREYQTVLSTCSQVAGKLATGLCQKARAMLVSLGQSPT
jgi:tetratricopeptide (TPR) repeat protein